MAFVLVSMKTKLDFFHHGTIRDVTLENQGSLLFLPKQISSHQSPVCGSVECSTRNPVKEHNANGGNSTNDGIWHGVGG